MKHILMILFILVVCFGWLSAGPIQTTVHVEFSHFGDNGTEGTASILEWKWTANTFQAWSQWTMITDTMTPLLGGTIDTAHFAIEFPGDGEYFIAVRAADEVSNWSNVCTKVKIVLFDQIAPSCSPITIIGIDR